MNIVHIIEDKKFIRSCEETFNIEGLNNFFLPKGSVSEEYLINNKIDLLIIHYLTLQDIKFINNNVPVKIIWFFWGADGFVFGKYYNSFLLPKTRRIRLYNEFRKSLKSGIKCLVKTVFPSSLDYSMLSKEFKLGISKIDYIIPVMPLDLENLKTDYGFINKGYHLNYVIPFFFDNIELENPVFEKGENIVLGNSASYTNNHIEAIDVLFNLNITSKVIIPLNYGDVGYTNIVSEYATKKLGGSTIILKEFMPYEEYCALMNSCSVVIMNHIRQQAVGNIILGLLTGKTIYLRKESTVFDYLIKQGFEIKKIEDIVGRGIELLKDESLVHNYHLAFAIFGKESAHKRIKGLIEILEGNVN